MLTLIVATAVNGAIGLNNKLIFDCPADMKHFKETTAGKTIIMGRKTFESIGSKPLPGRNNIIVSNTIKYEANIDIIVCSCLIDAIRLDNTAFIIGGASIYEQAVHHVDRILITIISDKEYKGDTFFHVPTDIFEVVKVTKLAKDVHLKEYKRIS